MNKEKQKTLSFTIVFLLLTSTALWYFLIQKELNVNISTLSNSEKTLNKSISDYKRLRDQLTPLQNEFLAQNTKFMNLLKRIPSITDKNESFEYFRNLLGANYFKIKNYRPYTNPIEEKKLVLTDSKNEITIQKIAVDVELTGDYITFGQFIDDLSDLPILVNLSEVELARGKNQQISFLGYLYFQSGNLIDSLVTNIDEVYKAGLNNSPEDIESENFVGGITTMPWKGEEVVVGIDDPQYTSDGLEIYAIEYEDGRKEFVERDKLPNNLFSKEDTKTSGNQTNRDKREIVQLKTQFSDQIIELEQKIKGFETIQEKQKQKYEEELTKAEQTSKEKLEGLQKKFEELLTRQEKKLAAFEEQEKIKQKLQQLDQNKADRETKNKIESLQKEFEKQLSEQQEKIIVFESLQEKQKQEMQEQKRRSEQSNKIKLEALQIEFEKQLNAQQNKISEFEKLQEQQKKEKRDRAITEKENRAKLKEIRIEFEQQLKVQQNKISEFEKLQRQQRENMEEQKRESEFANKLKLKSIQNEFSEQINKKEKQIAAISNKIEKEYSEQLNKKEKQIAAISNKLEKEYSEQLNKKEKQIAAISNKLAGKTPKQINKPEPTPEEKKKIQEQKKLIKKKKMKEFTMELKKLETLEKKSSKQKSLANSQKKITGPISRIKTKTKSNIPLPYENLDNVFANMAIDGVYRFGSAEMESDLVVITSGPKPIAQIKSGYWSKPGVWKDTYRNLTGVRIDNDKFFSIEYKGEFVFYDNNGELARGLRIDNPWTGKVNDKNYEIGKRINSIKNYYKGEYPFTSMRILSKSEIENMSTRDELKFMRNEIFARYGYMFEPKGRMDRHFSSTKWYKPQYDDVTNFLTDIEIQNVNQIQETELEFFNAINYLKGFAN